MCSFSDAHECAEIPFVAANVSRVIPAVQSQIWAVLRDSDSASRTVYSLCAAMIGRICLSGDVLNLSEEKTGLICRGLDFYRSVSEIVRDGEIVNIDCNIEYFRAACGRQIYEKQLGDRRLVIVHALQSNDTVEISLCGYRLVRAFTDCSYTFENDVLRFDCAGQKSCEAAGGKRFEKDGGIIFRAGAFLLEKQG